MDEGSRKNLIILSFTLVVVMLGYGMVIPILPFYVESMGAGGSELGLLVAAYALMRLIFAPLWGGLSDRVGRKPILMVGVLGYALAMLLFGLSNRLWMLFAARILSGILSSATAPTTMAYVSDSTSKEGRGGGMGLLGGALGLGAVLGPGLGGWLAGNSLALPFFIAAGLSVVSLLLIFFFLPESLPSEARQRTKKGVKLFKFRELWAALFSPIGVLLIMIFLITFGMTTFQGIFGLYALEKFYYGPEKVGAIMMVLGFVSALAQGVLTGPLTRRWGEAVVIRITVFAGTVGFLAMLMATTYITVIFTTGFFILSVAILGPTITSLTSKRAPMRQGVAMGISNSFVSLGRIGGPIWAGYVFDMNISYPYISGSVIMITGFVVSLIWVKQGDDVVDEHHEVSSVRYLGHQQD
jgi:DHA1 family multidrug resistance protein-like MFS transporter